MSENDNTILFRTGLNPARQFVSVLWKHRAVWMIPTALFTIVAVLVALFSPKSYMASQTLVIRDEFVGTTVRPGRFDSTDAMRLAEETVLEISRRPQVIRKALRQLGPPLGTEQSTWPTDLVIEQTQNKIQINAPNGAEFGKTETVVLSVTDGSKKRAARFIELLLDGIETNLREFRALRFKSMEEELAQGTLVSKHAYESAVAKLQNFERQFGADLQSLRSLNGNLMGNDVLFETLAEMMSEQRGAHAEVDRVQKQLDVVRKVQNDPTTLATASQEFLQLQPSLKGLMEGLNQALLRLSRNTSRYSENHPLVQSDRREIESIKSRMDSEIDSLVGSLDTQLALRIQKLERLNETIADFEARLGILGSKRVEYQQLIENVKNKHEIYGKSEFSLAEIQTLGAAAYNISLLTRVDKPQVGFHPVGPTNGGIVFGGMAGGLFIGLALIMFFWPIDFEQQPIQSQEGGYQLPAAMPGPIQTVATELVDVHPSADIRTPVAEPHRRQDHQTSAPVQRPLSAAAFVSAPVQTPVRELESAPEPVISSAPRPDLVSASEPDLVSAPMKAPKPRPAPPIARTPEYSPQPSSAPVSVPKPVEPSIQTVAPLPTPTAAKTKVVINPTSQTFPATERIGTQAGSTKSTGIKTPIRKFATKPSKPKNVSKITEKVDVNETALNEEMPVANFATPATKAMFDEISSRLQMTKENDPHQSVSDEINAVSDSVASRDSELENATESTNDSIPDSQPGSQIKTTAAIEKPEFASSPEPTAKSLRTTPITEPRRSIVTEVFAPQTSLDVVENKKTHVLTTDLPSETSKPDSSDTNGVPMGNLPEQQNPQDRRMAKTVDLRQLKRQLSGKIKGNQKTHEQSIADTIRAYDLENENAHSESGAFRGRSHEDLIDEIDRLTSSITDCLNRNDNVGH